MAERLAAGDGRNSTYSQAQLLGFVDGYALIETEVSDAKAEVSSCVRRRTSFRKQIKDAGIPLAEFDRALADSAMSGAERERADHHYRRIMAFMGKPIGTQSSLFEPDELDPAAFDVHQMKAIDNDGFDAGKGGKLRTDNPWSPGTENSQRWDTAWIRGQETIAADMATDAPAPRGRGRPRKVRDNGVPATE